MIRPLLILVAVTVALTNAYEKRISENIVIEILDEEVSDDVPIRDISSIRQMVETVPITVDDLQNSTHPTNETKKLVSCLLNEERHNLTIELVNTSRLAEILTPDAEITNRESEAPCVVVYFYSQTCDFSTRGALHFNALVHQYPYIKMVGVNSMKNTRVNTQYGIVGVPSMILFHNARAVAKYDIPEYSLAAFVGFIKAFTGLEPKDGDHLTYQVENLIGPIPTEMDEEIDYILLLAWAFIIICNMYLFSGTMAWKAIVETVKSSWREAEAQHEHNE